ncbi:MAG TPA: methionine--tRNA ligase [Pyrinomonadaceae bacterium]|jgi:methionyl-tRNA synthetase|nr:methionine--tRNA ligase [Pyrinomonadaceae bacterium]
MTQTFYITTPIYYANSLPHLGHIYTTTVADAIVRYKKQRGFETYFLTGTDEHGINIQRAADKAGRTPKEHVDFISDAIKKAYKDFGLDNYDIFMRTTEAFHYEAVQHLWREIAKSKTPKGNDPIYKGFYEGWFCAPCAAFKGEDEYYTPDGSDCPYCLIHERPLDKVSEESYFFRLSDYGDELLRIIEEKPERIRPDARRNEVTAFIKQGLQDLSISRVKTSVSWGIPVPDDENHTMYVWLDALSNYITALGYGNDGSGENHPGASSDAAPLLRNEGSFEKYWSNVTHLVGKDILRFHTVYWWSFLLAAGIKLPDTVYAHGLWLDGHGKKMSKTKMNAVLPETLKKYFSVDAVRYFLLREMVFGQDGRVSFETIIDRANSDLASGLGNLSSRTLTMIGKYCDGKIPAPVITEPNFIYAKRAGVQPDAQETASILEHARDEFLTAFDDYAFSRALETAWAIIARIDKELSDAKPWDLAKDEHQRETLNAVLYRAVEILRWLSVMLYPVMPEATQKIYGQIGLTEDISKLDPKELKWGGLPAGTQTGEIAPVFPRLDKQKIMEEINSSQQSVVGSQSETGPDQKAAVQTTNDEGQTSKDDFITIDDFLKVDLRVGTVLSAEKLPDADKLLLLKVDIGEEEPRQLLAGLAMFYEPEKLVGRKVVVVANLKPRKMRGLMSQGMICAASLGDGDTPAVATFIEDVQNGARLK